MATGERTDPLTNFNFLVELDGLVVGGFSEISGLQTETETEEYREGGLNEYTHKLPKSSKYSNVVLKRGLTDSSVLWDWYRKVVGGSIERKNGSIILLDYAGNEKWRWNFSQAFPVKWVGPDLKADSSTIAVETLELVHHGFTKG
ncbi:phage tail protein [Bacillus pseudomycoides]|uniref:phage tail protein n=1 Tax=Bacillus pseudomycoides TaxID=64104 RepID=UPI000BED11EB|nr:phage tail protein [Bacillus pseudomycoides]MBD5799852.1 phage tail protein [Bacillus pseudomycoides]MED1476526.1 phage tail protein [Bacillus pseudomycoides]PDZ13445.1 phage tail protein [Bacillus pseudomycoides]PEO83561.1 phage tail protein [Bacillus pseudomycoides]